MLERSRRRDPLQLTPIVPREEGRSHVHDVVTALRTSRDDLCFAIFDVGRGPETIPDFRKTAGLRGVPTYHAQDPEEVARLFKNWAVNIRRGWWPLEAAAPEAVARCMPSTRDVESASTSSHPTSSPLLTDSHVTLQEWASLV